jgi:membrane protein insertase Oxa1/YidC/SpoIIIJ|tara:strand:- start:1104 stop:1754 length:651 start_codon:yes stop_codon:yes gene_type:complete
MNDYLIIAFSPIIFLIENYYIFLLNIFNSQGISIILTSISASLLLIPILRVARVKEDLFRQKISLITDEVNNISKLLNGEEKFFAVDQIYTKYRFHPIHNMMTGLSFFVILPVLISAYLFFNINLQSMDENFLNLIKLSGPDELLFGFNIIPMMIFAVNCLDARYKYYETNSGKTSYIVLSLMISVLIYGMPSCLTLYWLTSSTFSLFFSIAFLRR